MELCLHFTRVSDVVRFPRNVSPCAASNRSSPRSLFRAAVGRGVVTSFEYLLILRGNAEFWEDEKMLRGGY